MAIGRPQMEEQIKATWYEPARREGVSEQDCETIKSAFVYPGFRLPLDVQAQAGA